ncbi:MAG TPA: GGDEF domain-containing protein [Kofleriaceae bacterium]|nr:GGDEF domain-containing protein [Kofleriaceae bacterium]
MSDRCYAIALLLTGTTFLIGAAQALGGWPFLPPESKAADLIGFNVIAFVSWAILAVVARLARGRDGDGVWLALATVLLYALTLAAFTLFTGPFGAPGWIGFLGGAVIGYVVFPRWVSLGGTIIYVVLVIVGAVLLSEGRFEGTMLEAASRTVRLERADIVRGAVATLMMSGLTFTIIMWIIDRWRDREARFERLATTDPLTGVANRRLLFDVSKRELARSRRYGTPTSLIIIDLDHFKSINDKYGHLVGDRALSHAADILGEAIRDADMISRYGGEEFGILLPMTDLDGAFEVAERCRTRLADRPFQVNGDNVQITASLGVASTIKEGDVDELLRRADDALLRAKATGRNRTERA